MGYGSILDSQATTVQAALDRAAKRNGSDNPTVDVRGMLADVGTPVEPCSEAVSSSQIRVGTNEGGE